MTKQEWLEETDLKKMLKQVKSDRKKQLFALACCRSIEYLMLDQRSKDCLEKTELFIDGKISREEFKSAKQDAYVSAYDAVVAITGAINWPAEAVYAAANAVYAATNAAADWALETANSADAAAANERDKQLELLRDIYNPFLLDLKFSQQAISLAEQVYDGDDKARGVLSDYLEEQGYPAEVVAHLKSGFHPKGCWLIDQILGK